MGVDSVVDSPARSKTVVALCDISCATSAISYSQSGIVCLLQTLNHASSNHGHARTGFRNGSLGYRNALS